MKAKEARSMKVQTIYVGGGCPSLLTIRQWKHLTTLLRKNFSLAPRIEFTVEIQPATTNRKYLLSLSQLGVNRLSFGIQSFNDTVRQAVGRKGEIGQAIDLVHYAKKIKVPVIGIDLIMGLPYQTFSVFQQDLSKALQLPIQHISLYFLSLEPKTPLFRNRKKLSFPTEEDVLKSYEYACSQLRKNGFIHYEVSNWARKGCECRHNKAYWLRQPYMGIGLGAHSFLFEKRFANTKNMGNYLQGKYKDSHSVQKIEKERRWEEYLLLRLRTREGINRKDVKLVFGKEKEKQLAKKVHSSPSFNLFRINKNSLRLTEKGLLFSDTVLVELL